ncbi:MAG: cyclic nucleotide-binding domain-containing protein [Pirellulales bacterium]|nr:cyclic nucleotide-binding domain-containing protein [Pirellulales bacterium]
MAVAIDGGILHHIPLFRGLNESELHQIIEVVQARQFATGELIIRQGAESRDLWVVLEGQCEVARRLHPDLLQATDGESLVLATLAPHAHFGEMSFFHPAPHSADVRARGAIKLLQIAHADYADMIEEGIWAAFKVAYNVVQGMAERLRRMDDWVAELATNPSAASNVPEWSRFRNKMFNGWSL